MPNFDDFDIAVKTLTAGSNMVVLDDLGLPSVMVALPRLNSQTLGDDMTVRTHPAWICGEKEQDTVYISKFQNIIRNHRAYSLPMQAPAVSVSFDEALAACRGKGSLWGLTPAALWSGIALWSMQNGTLPRGNNCFGCDYGCPEERGTGVTFSALHSERPYHTAGGSGPVTWNHNGQADGICDLNGNVFEWQAGIRLCRGELQIIPNVDCMSSEQSLDADSSAWRALDCEGGLLPPASEGSIKLDFVDGVWCWIAGPRFQSRVDTAKYCDFKEISQRLGTVPQILKELTLFPALKDLSRYGSEYFYGSNGSPESLMIRGGSFSSKFIAGLFCSGLNVLRDQRSRHIGFRAAYYGTP